MPGHVDELVRGQLSMELKHRLKTKEKQLDTGLSFRRNMLFTGFFEHENFSKVIH